MISNHLSLIDVLRPKSNELADQVEQWVLMGGKIEVPESVPLKHKTLSERRQPPNFQSPMAKSDTEVQVCRIRDLAKTLSRRQICMREGITLGVLKGIASRYGIKFPVKAKMPSPPNKADAGREALLLIRVKECIALGVSRQQCCITLKISSTLLYRLIKDYAIEYPKMKPAFR